ncbi:hypothetical protein J3998_04040 [Thiomicrorhabdus sp. 6S2-11]|uniref:Uncharacterized protein n=1 Tax=Thiomicrorhabdus marina TaxID=2818442 RepID=A0ABS3Q361_9GAMM|nr:hypothetical protein [Thiomicrorhabdus marina]MBO1926737.1 hypothetical protein [Thiomicrorhabdus marina]
MFNLINVLTVIFLLSSSALANDRAPWKYQDWQVEDGDIGFIASTNGKAVHGHSFGIMMPKGSCNKNILVLSLSSTEEDVRTLLNKEVSFEFKAYHRTYPAKIKLIYINDSLPITKILGFNFVQLSDEFIEDLKYGEELSVEIMDNYGLFGFKEEFFSLNGFVANYTKLVESCKDIEQLNIPPSIK